MYQHILVAVGPGFSEAALSVAIARSRESNARLTMLHVIDSAPWWTASQADVICCDTVDLVNQLALVVYRSSTKMLEEAGVEAHWETRRTPADGHNVGRIIAEAADELEADLIVLGGGKRSLFGIGVRRVSHVVCRHTDREVLIASERANERACTEPLPRTVWEASHA
ncbi:universal stress protein [Caballeronia sp. TF1N1]|uniref:universal stress protein n=1 Tax=Caballeronia sp. TF1N1 TaxID=2878153 RepID=UPI001FD50A21|nr:universal stress protein [Caballeronia sp. TF1N1]